VRKPPRGVAPRKDAVTPMRFKDIAVTLLSAACLFFLLAELATRLMSRNGRVYDIEMFKYSRLLKEDAPLEASQMHHWHRPNARAVLQGVTLAINSKRLRDYEHEYGVRPGVTRILVVGDSITLGWGVRMEDTYPKVLERSLRVGPGETRYEVLNAGVGNYTSSRIIGLYNYELHKYEPGVVVFAFFLNNANDVPDSKFKFLFETPLEFPVFLWSRYQRAATRYRLSKTFEEYYSDLYNESNPAFVAFRGKLKGFLHELHAAGKVVVVASIPDTLRLQEPVYPYQFITDKVFKIAAEENAHAVDLFPALQGMAPESIMNTPEDRHPNAEGHRRLGKSLHEYLRSLGI